MKIQKQTIIQRTFISEVKPEIYTTCSEFEKVIKWADENPVVWDIVTSKRSKAFGRGSCVYIGSAQNNMTSDAILERCRYFKELTDRKSSYYTDDSIFIWRARFTLKHYKEKGFRGGFFQQHDAQYPRNCLTLDYTPETLEKVLDKFCEWIDHTYEKQRITIDGKTVRVFKTA